MKGISVTEHVTLNVLGLPGHESVVLDLFSIPHIQEVFTLVDSSRRYLEQWLPWVKHTKSESDTMHFFIQSRAKAERGDSCDFVIMYKGQVCGMVSFNSFSSQGTGEIGYWLGQQYLGMGIMTRAVATLIKWGFETFPELHRVEIRSAAGNTKSVAIPQRLGFARDGELREATLLGNGIYVNAVVYSFLRRELPNLIIKGLI